MGRAVVLIGQKVIAAREGLGRHTDSVGNIDRRLMDLKSLELEGHENCPKMRRRTVEQ